MTEALPPQPLSTQPFAAQPFATQKQDPPTKPTSRLSLLFAPGERLGWIFRDRWRFLQRFPEPAPAMPRVPEDLLRRQREAQARLGRRIGMTLGVGIGAALLLSCLGSCVGNSSASASSGIFLIAALAFFAAIGGVGLIGWSYYNAGQAVRRAQEEAAAWHAQATADWQQRLAAFDQAERARIDGMLEWGAARTPDGTKRIDLFGGTLWSWESFLTVFGASMLSTRGAVTLLDLSGESVSAELIRLATVVGAGVELQRLPNDLTTSDLLVGLDQQQLVDALVESMHGDNPGASRADRAMDDRLLTAICGVIAPDLSFRRLTAAIHTVMGEPGIQPDLSEDERLRLADDLFSEEYRRQAHGHLRRIDSYIYPLQALGTEREDRPQGFLSCVTLDSDGRNARNELLVDLLVQWSTRRMLGPDAPKTLIIAGADELQRRHIERLSDICERRDIRLVFLFRHLRETSLHALGGGAVAFMRLGNHEEANRAAEFIGRQHKFVLSQLTRTTGGSETHGETDTEGFAETESLSLGTVTSSFSNWGSGGSSGGSSWNRGGGSSTSSSRTQGWSTTRNWSHAESFTTGTNWSYADSDQRVYEFAVEPTVLQHLPDYGMLLIEPRAGGPVPLAVECDPSIITLPRSSHEPLPPPPNPPNPLPNQAGQPYQIAGPPTTGPIPVVTPPMVGYPVSAPPGYPVSGPPGYPVSAPPGYPVSAPPMGGNPYQTGPMPVQQPNPPTPPHGWPQQPPNQQPPPRQY